VGVDGVGEGENRLVVGGGPLHGQLHLGVVVVLVEDVDHVRVERLPLGVEVLDEVEQAALVLEALGDGLLAPLVGEHDLEPAVEEGHLPQTHDHRVVIELDRLGEHLGVGPEGDGGAGLLDGLLPSWDAWCRAPPTKSLGPHVAGVADLGLEPLRKGVDDGDTHPVQTTGDLVGALLELAAGVEGGEHRGYAGELGLLHLVDRDAAAVVDHPDSSVGEKGDVDAGGVAGHRLVHRVVHDLPDQMMEAPGTGGSDVHARP
jgi:hypothetical protein